MDNLDLNTKIENAMKDKDISKIMSKACMRFNKQLDVDTLKTCKLNALWKSFLNFKPEKNTKFTTYLYNGVFIECLKEIKFKNKSSRCGGKLHENVSFNDNTTLMIDILDELQDQTERQMILDRISKMTINEMAKKYNVSRETVRKRIKKITKKFQDKFI